MQPTTHQHVSERETPPWICCVPCSGVMFIRQVLDPAIPATLAEAHALRKACGVPHPTTCSSTSPCGVSNAQLRNGLNARYGYTGGTVGTSVSGLWSAMPPGSVACITGRMGVFPAGHRLRRFDPGFVGLHKCWLYKQLDQGLWWDNPLAPAGTYQGEPVTKAEIELYVNGAISAGGAWIAAPARSDVAKHVQANGYGTESRKRLHVSAGMVAYNLDGTQLTTFAADADLPVFGLVDSHSGNYLVRLSTSKPYPDGNQRDTLALVKSAAPLTDVPPTNPPAATVLAPGIYEVQP